MRRGFGLARGGLLKAVFLVTIPWILTNAQALPEKMGDFDEDGTASILDVVRLINHVNQSRALPTELQPYGDMNNDGFLDQDDVVGLVDRVLERLPLSSLPLTKLRQTSPSSGEGDVAVTRETILRFNIPLAEEHGLSSETLFAEFGGEKLATRINVSPDRKTVTLFYDEPLPANARIRVTLVGDEVVDYQGRLIDGDGDGVEGGDLVFDFDTLSLTVLEGTAVCGRVFASELTVAASAEAQVNQPLEGALITVDGMENEVFAVTDEFGNFRLEPAPAGRFFVHVDGRTVTIDVPEGSYYPFVGKAWESIPGEEVNVGNVYLPLVVDGTLQNVSNTRDTRIGMPQAVVEDFPEFDEVSITVPAGSLFSDNGTRGGQVGIAPVDPQRLPGTLPPDLDFPLVITVQTDGATNFDIPAPVCFPNLPDPDTGEKLKPGEKSALWSFNHDTGRFEIVGSMTVSRDGTLVCTDPGVGILAPGWHGTIPGAVVQGGGIVTAEPGATTDMEPGTSPEARAPPACTLWGLCGPLNEIESLMQDVFNQAHSAFSQIKGFVEGVPQAIWADGKTDPVYYFSGEFSYSSIDLRIKGRGLDFIWSRRYRSKVGPSTEMGHGWDYSYRVSIEQDGEDLLLYDGNGRADRYTPSGTNRWSRGEFFRDLRKNGDGSYTLEFEDKGRWLFHPFEAASGPGKLAAIVDRNGNQLDFFYDAQHRLTRVSDTLDRDIVIGYNAEGFIATVTDFAGRTVTYDYYDGVESGGAAGDLKSCTSPMVTGTPHGNDFPQGKTTSYTYTTGFADERLNHNLLTITDGRRNDPSDPTFGDGPYLRNVYTSTRDPEEYAFDRVARQVWGGDVVDLVYEPLAPSGADAAATKTIVNDRNGNVTEYYFDAQNRLVVLREYTGRASPASPTNSLANRPSSKLRSSDPAFFETRYSYNDDSLVSEIVHPNGNLTQNIYEGDLNPAASARTRGNLRIARRLPGSHLPAGDQGIIEESFEYDSDFGCGSCGFNFVTKHVDGRGNETRMTYDDQGNLTRTAHRISSIVEEYEYNAFGQLAARVLPDNGSGHRRRDEFTYYDAGSARGYMESQIVDAENLALTTTLNYDPVGNVVSITDPRGNDRQFVYNELDQVVRTISREVSDGSGVRYERDYHYDANNNLVRLDVQNIDADGVLEANSHFTTTYEYDTLNKLIRLVEEVDASSDIVTEFAYDGNRNLTLVRKGEATNGSQPANAVSYAYDERDLLFTETRAPGDADQSTTQFDYDSNRNRIRVRQGLEGSPRVTVHVYDAYDRMVGAVDPMGNEAVMTYDANGNVVGTRVDGEPVDVPGSGGNVRLTEALVFYDPLDRAIRAETAFFDTETGADVGDGLATSLITYADNSEILSLTDDNGNTTTFSYDTVNRQQRITDAKANERLFQYDANSNLISVLSVEKRDLGGADQEFTTTYEYDNLDRRIREIDNRGNALSSAYDSRSNPTRSVDALGNVTVNAFDGLNRLLMTNRLLTDNGLGTGSVVDQIVTQNVWDDSSRLIQRIDPNGNVTETAYDALDRAVQAIFADGTQRQAQYDSHDNIVALEDANGNVAQLQYDALDRLSRRDISPGAGVSADTTFEEYTYDGLSRLVRAEDDDSVVVRAYDSLSNMVAETLNGQTTTAEFDGVGNMIGCIYPSGRSIACDFDALNRKASMMDVTAPSSPAPIADFAFVGPNRLARRDYGNGTRTDFVYNGITGVPNPAGDFGVKNLIETAHSLVSSGAPLAGHSYTWDSVGNKTSRSNSVDPLEQTFAYDSAYRLIESVRDGSATSYDIDLAHNRTQVTGAQNPGNYTLDATTPEPADAQMNQYSTTPQGSRTHDENGNLLSDAQERSFVYDYANRMVAFSGSGTEASYQYDALGRRIAKTVDGATVRFFYAEGDRVCEEQDGTGVTLATYVYGLYIDDVVQMERGDEAFYYHADDLYSVVALTGAGGAVVEDFEYEDYGNPLTASGVGNPYLFTGRRYDAETGFYYYRTRYMDPLAGRFTTRDGIGIWADGVNLGNGFGFVGANPRSLLDPHGRRVEIQWHEVAFDSYHALLRITPEPGSRFANHELVVNTDPKTGERYFTMGGGPPTMPQWGSGGPGWYLISAFNRSRDVGDSESLHEQHRKNRIVLPLPNGCESEDELIERLIATERHFPDSEIDYDFFPAKEGTNWVFPQDGHNSNSYISGLLRSIYGANFVPDGLPVSSLPGFARPVSSDAYRAPPKPVMVPAIPMFGQSAGLARPGRAWSNEQDVLRNMYGPRTRK